MTSDRRSVLITGCSSGIGLDAARTLAARGWRVLATCRQPADCARLAAEGLESFPLDLADEAGLATAAAEALDRTGGRLDALVNNGAFAIPAPSRTCRAPRSARSSRPTSSARSTSPTACCRRCAPPARGRVVMISSILGLVAAPWRGAYVASKFALEGITDALRLELAGSGIAVVLIEPGPIGTPFRRNAIPHFERHIDWRASPHRAAYETRLIPRLHAADGRPDRFQLPPAAVSARIVARAREPAPARPLLRHHADPRRRPAAPPAPGARCSTASCAAADRRGSGRPRKSDPEVVADRPRRVPPRPHADARPRMAARAAEIDAGDRPAELRELGQRPERADLPGHEGAVHVRALDRARGAALQVERRVHAPPDDAPLQPGQEGRVHPIDQPVGIAVLRRVPVQRRPRSIRSGKGIRHVVHDELEQRPPRRRPRRIDARTRSPPRASAAPGPARPEPRRRPRPARRPTAPRRARRRRLPPPARPSRRPAASSARWIVRNDGPHA